MSKSAILRLVGDRFPSLRPQDAGVHQSDSAQAKRAQVAYALTSSIAGVAFGLPKVVVSLGQ